MTLRHFRIFQAVAEEESITRAAERLYLTQPSVSIAIREMETHYGTRFFDRINQRLKITAQGRLLLDHVRPFLSPAVLAGTGNFQINGEIPLVLSEKIV